LFLSVFCQTFDFRIFRKTAQKYRGGENGIGLCQLPVGVGGALRVCLGWDGRDAEVGGKGEKGGMPPVVLGKIGVDGAKKVNILVKILSVKKIVVSLQII